MTSFYCGACLGPRTPSYPHVTDRQRFLQIASHLPPRPPPTLLTNPSQPCYAALRPGHYLSPGEDEALGLKRRLDIQLTGDITESTLPPGISASGLPGGGADLGGGDWEVGDCLGTWWRPNYETYMVRVEQGHRFLGWSWVKNKLMSLLERLE